MRELNLMKNNKEKSKEEELEQWKIPVNLRMVFPLKNKMIDIKKSYKKELKSNTDVIELGICSIIFMIEEITYENQNPLIQNEKIKEYFKRLKAYRTKLIKQGVREYLSGD